MVRKHIFFSGDVQGVGFRYRSFYIAQSLGLAGWVENLWDGRVEMEVQGSEASIREMLDRIQQQRWINVADMEITEIPCEEEKRGGCYYVYQFFQSSKQTLGRG